MRVCLDTNALMMPVECDVRVFEELDRVLGEYEAVVPRAVVAELEKLAGPDGEEGIAASVGRDLADRCPVLEHEADYADDAVVELATDGGAAGSSVDAVATNDQPLRDRLLARGVPVIGLRGRNELAVTQP